MDIVGIIPSRWASARFPGKPLADINGKTMIHRVYERAAQCTALSLVVVATDDERIANEVKSFGGLVVMTNKAHPSGTDRCLEALLQLEQNFGAVINIQGDEPFVDPKHIDLLAGLIEQPDCQIATLISPIKDQDDLFNHNVVKAVKAHDGHVLYFSRQAIPHIRDVNRLDWPNNYTFYRHLGMYAYTAETLEYITKLEISPLEQAESLEQLRWLENGFRIRAAVVSDALPGVDTPADIDKLLKFFDKASQKP